MIIVILKFVIYIRGSHCDCLPRPSEHLATPLGLSVTVRTPGYTTGPQRHCYNTWLHHWVSAPLSEHLATPLGLSVTLRTPGYTTGPQRHC
jgi:hypothetical protein